MAPLKLSVKALVDFACRSGDLSAQAAGPSAIEGVRAHQRLQRELAGEYQAEVPVTALIRQQDGELQLGGRIDLLKIEDDGVTLAEIKSCYGHPSRLPAGQQALHRAQLKIYGYCYLLEHGCAPRRLEMIWYDLLQQQRHLESEACTEQALLDFGEAAVARCLAWHKLLRAVDDRGRASARQLEFPFNEFRPGQRAMANAVYRCLRDQGHLLCEAPTGIGKTVSALFPAVKALGAQEVDKIVYLTAKTSGRRTAQETMDNMGRQGLSLTSVTIQAKRKTCPCTDGGCELDEHNRCPLTLGFFDRLPAARDALIACGTMDTDTIARVAAQYRLCPFELSLQMLPWARVVICDYNYVFDPLVSLSYFGETRDRIALLIDEAHNLVDRARQMYSARLSRSQSQQATSSCKTSNPQLSRKLASITRALDRWQRQLDREETVDGALPATVGRAVDRLLEHLGEQTPAGGNPPRDIGDWLKEVYRYRHIAGLFGPHHRCITRCNRRGPYREVELKLSCLNADQALADSYDAFHGVVQFSATLRPSAFYRDGLGLPPDTTSLALPSPFPPERLGSFLCSDIDTRYRQRQHSIEPLCRLIHGVYHARPGNYLVFFPSYHYLQQVAEVFAASYPGTALLVQQRDAGEAQRAEFLQQFQPGRNQLGFAIMGGIFGEGIDYSGDSLIGAIVIGVGLPGIDTEQELIREDYEARGLDGYDFAYRYPGLSRVLQAAGRVIRSERDRGIVVLVERRFQQAFYRQLLPQHWQLQHCRGPAALQSALADFWCDGGT